MTATNYALLDQPAACIGWDWGFQKHAIAMREAGSQKVTNLSLAATPEALHGWLNEIEARFGSRPVAVALEGTKGPVFSQLLERPWIRIYGVHPATSKRVREAFTPSGAKDDRPDALVLLDLVENSRHKLRPLFVLDAATAKVEQLSVMRRDMVDRRTQLTNQMDSLLKQYFPQALELVGENMHGELALEFLKRWPSLVELKGSREETIKRFYYQHNVRSESVVEKRLKLVAEAKFVMQDQQRSDLWKMNLASLVELVRVANKHLELVEKELAEAVKVHPDAGIFTELPGAGPVFAARLLAAFGEDRSRWESAESLQKYSGVAPVMERSGKSCVVRWRYLAPQFMRQTFVEWARCTIRTSAWAMAYYEQQREKGKSNWGIYRSLAYKWIRILWRCWRDRKPYNETEYLKALEQRNSPLARRLKTMASESKNPLNG